MSPCPAAVFNFLLFAVALFTTVSSSEVDYSSYVPNCRTKDAGFNECLRKFFQGAIPYSYKGIPEMSIPSIDPYFIPHTLLQSPLGLTIELSNTSFSGFGVSNLKTTKADVDKYHFEFNLQGPKTSYIGHYKLSGKLFVLSVQGEGRSNFTFIEHQNLIKIQGEPDASKTDAMYMKVKQVTCVMKAKRVRSYFERPFKNNKELSDVVNQLMNDQWEEVFNQFKPRLEEELAKHVFNIAQKYFSHIPYKTIFPE